MTARGWDLLPNDLADRTAQILNRDAGGRSVLARDLELIEQRDRNATLCACPWHQSRYDATTGRVVVGPQAGSEKVPGLDTAFIQLTKLWPLRRAEVVERGGNVYVRT
jgi:nitrite reductase/ring-hydroxylating ferredoxin subunit